MSTNTKKIVELEPVFSFGIGVLLFLYFDLRVSQFVWGLFFVLVFSSAIVIFQCIISAMLITIGVVSRKLIAHWSPLRVVVAGFWSTVWRLLFTVIIWSIQLYLCFLLIVFLFPPIETFSATFSFVDLSFYRAEVLPILLIVIGSTILIEWRLAIAPLLATGQQLEKIASLNKGVPTKEDRSYLGTANRLQHGGFSESIGEVFTFYSVEISKRWVKIMMVCAFYIIVKAFSLPDLVVVVTSHAIVCFTIRLR